MHILYKEYTFFIDNAYSLYTMHIYCSFFIYNVSYLLYRRYSTSNRSTDRVGLPAPSLQKERENTYIMGIYMIVQTNSKNLSVFKSYVAMDDYHANQASGALCFS